MSCDDYARALARVAMGTIVRQTSEGLEGDTGGLKLIERSCGETLLDVLARYLRTLGAVSAEAARHAGRSESNFEDVRHGLEAMGAGASSSLLDFLRTVPEEDLLQNVAGFPVVSGQPPAAARPAGGRHAGTRPPHVPDFLPPFPDPCTYLSTATGHERNQDKTHAKRKRSLHKREAQDSLHALEQRLESGDRAAACCARDLRGRGGDEER